MSQVEFIYNSNKTKIQCNENEKMEDIIQKFLMKVKKKKEDIYYTYNGNIGIKEELKFEEAANKEDKLRKKMSIIAYDNDDALNTQKETDLIKSPNIICPICKENIKMDIKDYKITLSDCINGHKFENILLNEFSDTQIIDRIKISCDICKFYNKSITHNNIFYKCNKCNKNICTLCKIKHESEHKIINYDDKYYICDKHDENYTSYCEECKVNICTLCDKHKNHKRINFMEILPNKQELIKKKKTLCNFINQFKSDVNNLINILNDVKDKMDIYYQINESIIDNYENKSRNYETIYYLRQFQKNNIINKIIEVLESPSMKDKFNNIFDIYSKMNFDEIKLIYKINNQKEIKLFNKDFVETYKKCCKIKIGNKEQELKEKYNLGIFHKKKDFLELKLKGITNITKTIYMFNDCDSLFSLPDLNKWNTINIKNMSWMFSNCTLLSSLPDISNWNIENVSDMRCMFINCTSLKSLPDISKWNTSNVTNMSGMFANCTLLSSLPDISKWDINNVIDMSYMFNDCISLLSIPDFTKWKIGEDTNKNDMFGGCINIAFENKEKLSGFC